MPRPSSLGDVLRQPLNLAILLVFVIAGGLYLYAAKLEQRHDAAARHYMETALADISRWQPAALRHHLADAAQATVDEEQLRALVERYRPLGAFRALDEPRFAWLTAALSLLGGDTLLGYSAQVHFDNGSARLSAVLVVTGADYRFYNFNLSTPELAAAL